MSLEQYDVVEIKAFNVPEEVIESSVWLGDSIPKVGDFATIIEIYGKLGSKLTYELECQDEKCLANWVAAFPADSIVLEKVNL